MATSRCYHEGVAARKQTYSTKQLEQQLKESLERYELLAKATQDVIYDLDIRTAHVTWNDALSIRYGHTLTDEVATLEWWAGHIHPDDAFRVEEEINALLESRQQTWFSEYRFQKADGEYAFVRDRAFVLRDANGAVQRIIGSMLDITDQKQLDRAKDEFLSLVSHQLRTPLTIVRMLSGMLAGGQTGELSPLQQGYAQQIAEASARMVRLVGDILNISRLELGRISIRPLPVNVNTLIQTYIDELTPLAQEKGVRILFTPERTLPMVPLDAMVFGQILHNLLTNAIRYTLPDKGHIRVTFIRKDGAEYVLSVADNGIGIPKTAQAHIFDRFYRAANAKRSDATGTGLGLYLVKLAADAFGGRIWVESKPGRGATFYIGIPQAGMQARDSVS